MRVRQLRMQDYRGIPDLRLDFDDHLTVLVGANGVGKSSVLRCLVSLLEPVVVPLYDPTESRRFFQNDDVSNGREEAHFGITLDWRGQRVQWGSDVLRGGAPTPTVTRPVGQAERILEAIQQGFVRGRPSPVITYYGVNRALVDVPWPDRSLGDVSRSTPYEGWHEAYLKGASADLGSFLGWFRDRHVLELEKRQDGEEGYSDAELDAVRSAVESLVPGVSRLRVRHLPLRVEITKDGDDFELSQLSDGEKCLVALVADLAWRFALCNPGAENPLAGDGIVLIDEVDLHLHPAWQRMVLTRLQSVFPNCQFIVTTHSPQILGEVEPECVWLLVRDEGAVRAERPPASFGLDSNTVLEALMGGSARSDEPTRKLAALFRLIDAGALAEAEKELAALASELPSNSELDRARVRLEWLRGSVG